MALFDANAITEAANADGEFKLAARLWNADLRFEVGADAYLMEFARAASANFPKPMPRNGM